MSVVDEMIVKEIAEKALSANLSARRRQELIEQELDRLKDLTEVERHQLRIDIANAAIGINEARGRKARAS